MPPSLPGAAQRLEALEEAAEHLAAQLARRPVDLAALVDGHRVAQVFRQHLELHGMPRHQAERLDVHREAVRRAVCPALDHRLARKPVVRRVDLDRVEELRVPREPLLRGQLRRIEVLRERVVGPGARADADGRRHAFNSTRKAPSPGPSSVRRRSCSSRYGLTFTTGLVAVHGGSVALTQPAGATVAGSGLMQPCAVKSRSVTVAVALKYVVFFGLTLPEELKRADGARPRGCDLDELRRQTCRGG